MVFQQTIGINAVLYYAPRIHAFLKKKISIMPFFK